jgi:hypothetical protein
MCDENDPTNGIQGIGFCNMTIPYSHPPNYSALSANEFLAKNKMTVGLHPPYSPDSALCDFLLFPQLNITLRFPYTSSIH